MGNLSSTKKCWDVSYEHAGTADGIIGNIRRKYVDTRSQANLSKINSDASQDVDILSEIFSQIVKRRRRFGMVLSILIELQFLICHVK